MSVLAAIGAASALAALGVGAVAMRSRMARRAGDDPFLWLEAVDGEDAIDWVKAQNKRAVDELEGDSRFDEFHAATRAIYNAQGRIPASSLVGRKVRNFWQDADYVRGIWREADLEAYLSGAPQWRTICDFDALANAENENWVFQGADYLAPDYTTCIVTLSRGGSDAAVRREFDVAAAAFVENGFSLPESKGSTAWLEPDALLVGIDVGPGSLTQSGYPRTTRALRANRCFSCASWAVDLTTSMPEIVSLSPALRSPKRARISPATGLSRRV